MDISEKEEMLAVAPEGATEEPLIEESVWGAVRALRERGLSKKEIGRQLDLDIKTVRKFPILGEIPILNLLFKHTSTDKIERDLVMMGRRLAD